MGFLNLFVVALMPILTTLFVTALGLLLALDRFDLLGPVSRNHLNKLVFYVFSPAIVGGYLANSITLSSLITLWFMPVNVFLTFVIGSALAWILNKIARTPHHLRGLVIGCCSAGNLGNLMLIIVPQVCEESDSLFGDSTTCTTSGETYTSLSMSLGSVFIWSYVYPIMCSYANKSDHHGNVNEPSLTLEVSEESHREALLVTHGETKKVRILEEIDRWFKKLNQNVNLKRLIPPSIIAAIIGLTIGLVPQIRNQIIGDSAPLRAIASSVTLLGQAAIPCITLIVGSNLLGGLRGSGVGPLLIIGIITVRCFALPLIGIWIVKGAVHFGMVGSDLLLYHFVLMLQYAVPPAMNIGLISQLFGAGQSECSVILMWTYFVAAFSLTLWSTLFLWIVS